MPEPQNQSRLKILVTGTVQGVGFRPFIYNLACKQQLSGHVKNLGGSVEIEIQGKNAQIKSFLIQLEANSPPLAAIASVSCQSLPLESHQSQDFRILSSSVEQSAWQTVPADTATCRDCLEELFDPNNRRFGYPFINCTNCGPRFTIIKRLPYDRNETTMSEFPMCQLCNGEYNDPSNRRFHAQPNACWDCGPTLVLKLSATGFMDNGITGSAALHQAIDALRQGKIIALKGLGGFHLVCDATNHNAVSTLRLRKQRYGKPLAVMFSHLEMLDAYCCYSEAEKSLISSHTTPIVLLKKRLPERIADSVAPNMNVLGCMLPYTPLHHLLLHNFNGPLVMTSGNISENPIAITNEEAENELSSIADLLLLHNRKIISRYDDSVIRVTLNRPLMIRRSRGYAPESIKLPFKSQAQILAFGAHLKNTFCLIKNDRAYLSQHIGDLENLETLEHFQSALKNYQSLFNLAPEILAADCHPNYLATELAEQYSRENHLPLVSIQHHHAHIASCAIEHGLSEPVIGIVFDGLGLGMDGNLWGGEFLVADLVGFQRFACFKPVPMPGAQAAIKQPWRMSLGYILTAQDADKELFEPYIERLSKSYGKQSIRIIEQLVSGRLNSPLTTSCGRLFDAMASLLGVCDIASFEAQAAMELEALAASVNDDNAPQTHYEPMQQPERNNLQADAKYQIDALEILKDAYSEYLATANKAQVAWNFHRTIAQIILDVCLLARKEHELSRVCLAGGVFQNSLLLELTESLLSSHGFSVFFPQKIPSGDGGISLGQAVIAMAQLAAIKD
jgi:hydrogenase maturation protein HypF